MLYASLAVVASALLALNLWLVVRRAAVNAELEKLRAERAGQQQQMSELRQRLERELAGEHETRAALQRERERREDAERSAELLRTQLQEVQEAAARKNATPNASPRSALNFVPQLALHAGLVRRDAELPLLIVPPSARRARLVLLLEDDSTAHYRAALQSGNRLQVWEQGDLKSRSTRRGKAVVVMIPASRLSTGNYVLTLTGLRPDGGESDTDDYHFRVKK